MGLLPPFENEPDDVGRSVYLPPTLWEKLTEISEETKVMDPKRKGYSRNELIKHALRQYVEDWEREKASKKRK